jgi:hypothetical protein
VKFKGGVEGIAEFVEGAGHNVGQEYSGAEKKMAGGAADEVAVD